MQPKRDMYHVRPEGDGDAITPSINPINSLNRENLALGWRRDAYMREISKKAPVRARGSALTQLNEALALVNDVRGVGDHSRRSLDAHRGVVVDARVCTCAGVVIA